mgnify:CR=1 FL=1
MRFILFLVFLCFSIYPYIFFGQVLTGTVFSGNQTVPFANITIHALDIGSSSNKEGNYIIEDLSLGSHKILISSLGMKDLEKDIIILEGENIVDFQLEKTIFNLDQVVVTATKTFKKRTDIPVIVNIIDSKKMQDVQACNLSEVLNFQSGVRVETDCQTCNYTQLRMNGLGGGYSQILINGKSIFSPLAGLYAMEQLPVSMIDKVEVIKGGGSSLYGSSAVAGVVNIITKKPIKNSSVFSCNLQNVDKSSFENNTFFNTSLISGGSETGVSFFGHQRVREWYDNNGDGFSELPKIDDKSFGMNLFSKLFNRHKFQLSISSIDEYRYGGEMVDVLPHFAMQSEERNHKILLANIDYEISFSNTSLFTIYAAAQKTDRDHYTGIRPNIYSTEDTLHLLSPPYGLSSSITRQMGFQIDHSINNNLGDHIFTLGGDYLYDKIYDEISSYNYIIDQAIYNMGWFVQSDWSLNNRFSMLSGSRIDKHSLLNKLVFSPRFSLLYSYDKACQIRASYSSGFRAPQAFDADMHMAFAGGGVSRIILDENLVEEYSKSLSASINYDKITEKYIYGFTLESFYTMLDNVFFLESFSSDSYGDIFVKRNSEGALVQGFTLEGRLNYNQAVQLESSFTLQKSEYSSSVYYSENLSPRHDFLRTPNKYGYMVFSYTPNNLLKFSASLIHTGSMDIVHFSGSPEQLEDSYYLTEVFNVIGLKGVYKYDLDKLGIGIEWSIGVKNLANQYQDNFDTSKFRDSNFIYGPALPRTFYLGFMAKL